MVRSRNLVLGLSCFVCLAAASLADEALPLPAGTRVRVTAPLVSSERLTGTLAAASEREIVLVLSSTERKTIARGAVTRLEWSRGRHGHPIAGAVVGAVLGGAFLAAASYALCDNAASCSPSMEALLAGAALGALPGAGVGALVKSERWAEASPTRVQVTLVPLRGRGAAMNLSLRF